MVFVVMGVDGTSEDYHPNTDIKGTELTLCIMEVSAFQS